VINIRKLTHLLVEHVFKKHSVIIFKRPYKSNRSNDKKRGTSIEREFCRSQNQNTKKNSLFNSCIHIFGMVIDTTISKLAVGVIATRHIEGFRIVVTSCK
jgi:hypothetical protein